MSSVQLQERDLKILRTRAIVCAILVVMTAVIIFLIYDTTSSTGFVVCGILLCSIASYRMALRTNPKLEPVFEIDDHLKLSVDGRRIVLTVNGEVGWRHNQKKPKSRGYDLGAELLRYDIEKKDELRLLVLKMRPNPGELSDAEFCC